MASEIDICNSALVRLGAATINAFSDNTVEAELCDQIFERVRDAVLVSHPWNFAIRRASLAALSTTPAWGYTYEFQLPTDCLRVLGVQYGQVTEYKVEGRKILANVAPMPILYIFKETLTGNYSAHFRECFEKKLALELAYALVQSTSQQQQLQAEYAASIADARSFDAQEGTPEEAINDEFLRSRVLQNDGSLANW
jgi:hypothetical protein